MPNVACLLGPSQTDTWTQPKILRLPLKQEVISGPTIGQGRIKGWGQWVLAPALAGKGPTFWANLIGCEKC